MRPRSPARIAVQAGVLALVSGCALDSRDLRRLEQGLSDAGPDQVDSPDGAGGVDGKSAAGGSDGGFVKPDASSPSPEAGEPRHDAGRPVGEPPPEGDAGNAPDCPDEDHDGTPDCRQSLVTNWTFDGDAAHWNAEDGATLAWRAEDAFAGASGSLSVRDRAHLDASADWAFTAATQCIAATAKATYAIDAYAFIPGGQKVGGANVSVWFFDDAACSGVSLLKYDAPPSDKVASWTHVSGAVTAPTSARSLLVRLVALKPLSDPAFEAQFDSVHLLSTATQ